MRKILLVILLCSSISDVSVASSEPVFIPNYGQWDESFSHKSKFGSLVVFTTQFGFRFLQSEGGHHHSGHVGDENELVTKHAFSLNLKNANPLEFIGEERRNGIHNYFHGNDPSQWVRKVPLFGRISSQEAYDGIDLQVYSSEGAFKYDFIVKPGARPEQIELKYSGLDLVAFHQQTITLSTSLGELVESIPISYQIIDGKRVEVVCYYQERAGGFGFYFPEGYNESYPLIIDPVLVAATLSGTTGTNENFGHGATFDIAGNIYTQGISFDSEFPTDEGSFQQSFGGGVTDAVISKYTSDGTELIYATFLGGDEREYPISSFVNGNEEIYVFGITDSPNYPIAQNAYQAEFNGAEDIFITALSADGSELVGSTYLGGSGFDGRNFSTDISGNYTGEIELNINGEVFLATCSSSDDFPTTPGSFQEDKQGLQDGVLLKMNNDLSELIWSTFIGSEGADMAYSISLQDDQTIYACGSVSWNNQTGSGAEGFVTTEGAYQTEFSGVGSHDGFITHFEPDGSAIISSTLLGLESLDRNYFVDFDSNGDIWVLMQTFSPWTATEGVWGTGSGNLCIHKITPDLTELLITSYLTTGSSGNATPTAFMVDNCNNVYVSGYFFEGTADFTATEDAIFDNGGFYVGVFAPDMADLEYGTYYTGNHVDGGTSRFDKQGIIYQGVCSCEDFNTTDDAWATTSTTVDCDVAVFKIDFETETVFASAGAAGFLTGCAPHTVPFQNFSTGQTFEWDFDNGTTSNEFEPTITFDEPGEYLVQLVVTDPESCNLSDTTFVQITVFSEVDFFADFSINVDCETGEVQITDQSEGPGDIEYEWDMGDGTILTDVNPIYAYDEAGTYTITLTLSSAACDGVRTFEQTIEYGELVEADFDFQIEDICESFTVNFTNQSTGDGDYFWNMGDGNILIETGAFAYTYNTAGTYIVQLVIQNELSCNLADTIAQVIEVEEPPVLDPQISITQTGLCEDLTYVATAIPNGPAESVSWFINGQLTGTEIQLDSAVSEPGLYNVQVIITDPVCQNDWTDEIEFEFFETLGFELPPNTTLCFEDESVILDATVPFADAIYEWNNGISSESVLEVFEEGNFEVAVSFNGCLETQATDVSGVQELPLAFNALICAGQPNYISFQDELGLIEQVNWADGQTGFQIEVSEEGYYPFTAIDIFGCNQVDSLLAIARNVDNSELVVPNVFTPNGDGVNDFFQIQADELIFYELEIYNRWGRRVFEADDINANWNGDYTIGSGSESNESTFFYILKYRDLCSRETQVKKGTLQVLR